METDCLELGEEMLKKASLVFLSLYAITCSIILPFRDVGIVRYNGVEYDVSENKICWRTGNRAGLTECLVDKDGDGKLDEKDSHYMKMFTGPYNTSLGSVSLPITARNSRLYGDLQKNSSL